MNIDKILDIIGDIDQEMILAKDEKPLAVIMSLDRYKMLMGRENKKVDKEVENNINDYAFKVKKTIMPNS